MNRVLELMGKDNSKKIKRIRECADAVIDKKGCEIFVDVNGDVFLMKDGKKIGKIKPIAKPKRKKTNLTESQVNIEAVTQEIDFLKNKPERTENEEEELAVLTQNKEDLLEIQEKEIPFDDRIKDYIKSIKIFKKKLNHSALCFTPRPLTLNPEFNEGNENLLKITNLSLKYLITEFQSVLNTINENLNITKIEDIFGSNFFGNFIEIIQKNFVTEFEEKIIPTDFQNMEKPGTDLDDSYYFEKILEKNSKFMELYLNILEIQAHLNDFPRLYYRHQLKGTHIGHTVVPFALSKKPDFIENENFQVMNNPETNIYFLKTNQNLSANFNLGYLSGRFQTKVQKDNEIEHTPESLGFLPIIRFQDYFEIQELFYNTRKREENNEEPLRIEQSKSGQIKLNLNTYLVEQQPYSTNLHFISIDLLDTNCRVHLHFQDYEQNYSVQRKEEPYFIINKAKYFTSFTIVTNREIKEGETLAIDPEDPFEVEIDKIIEEPHVEPEPQVEIPEKEPEIPYKILKGVPDLGDNVIFKQNQKTYIGVITGMELGPNDESGYQIMNTDAQQFFVLPKNVEKIEWNDKKNLITEKDLKQKKFDKRNK